jgi:hypothetical protein
LAAALLPRRWQATALVIGLGQADGRDQRGHTAAEERVEGP